MSAGIERATGSSRRFTMRRVTDRNELKAAIHYLAYDAEAIDPVASDLLRAVARALEVSGVQGQRALTTPSRVLAS